VPRGHTGCVRPVWRSAQPVWIGCHFRSLARHILQSLPEHDVGRGVRLGVLALAVVSREAQPPPGRGGLDVDMSRSVDTPKGHRSPSRV
jgi:hypothetical protein